MGTIQRIERQKGTIWRVREEVPPDPLTGKRRWKWVTAPTKKEVERKVADIRSAVGRGRYQEWSREPLADYLDRWLAMKASELRGSSLMRARADIVRHILPTLGALPLCEIRPAHIQSLYAAKQSERHSRGAGYAASSIVRLNAVLSEALRMAFEQELIARNPCAAVRLPRVAVAEPAVWTAAEAKLFLAACADHPWGCFFRLMLFTGMRKGELLGLRWGDLDLEAGTLAVRRTRSVDAGGRAVLNAPKTETGRRVVTLPPSCVAALVAHRARQHAIRLAAVEWRDLDHVFTNGRGEMWYPLKVNSELDAIVAEQGLPRLRVHDLRHTSATLSLAQGVDARVVQMRLGHATVAMTRRYQHPAATMEEEAADRMERALGS